MSDMDSDDTSTATDSAQLQAAGSSAGEEGGSMIGHPDREGEGLPIQTDPTSVVAKESKMEIGLGNSSAELDFSAKLERWAGLRDEIFGGNSEKKVELEICGARAAEVMALLEQASVMESGAEVLVVKLAARLLRSDLRAGMGAE